MHCGLRLGQPPREHSRNFPLIRHFIHYSHYYNHDAILEYIPIPLSPRPYCIRTLYHSKLHSILGQAIDPPTRAWLADEYGNEVSALRLIPSVEMTPLFCSSDVPGARFQLKENLPAGLDFDSFKGRITGIPIPLHFEATYNLTATNSAGSVSTTFSIVVEPCEYGDLLYPEFLRSGYGHLALSSEGTLIYNKTVKAEDAFKNGMCLPRSSIDYTFSCLDSITGCSFYIDDQAKNVYLSFLSVFSIPKAGSFEVKPTKKPSLSISPLVTLFSGEQVYVPIHVEGVWSSITVSPSLPSELSIADKVPMITGNIKESLMKKYTLTASNAIGETSVEFTLAVDQCPEGLKSMMIQLRMNKVFERWQVYDSQNTLLFDQLEDYRSTKHRICWTPGTYRFDLFSTQDPGWSSSAWLDVMDETGVLAEFQLPSDAMKVSRHFTWEYAVPQQSEWKIKRGSVDKKWTRVRYNDKKWESGHDGAWGSFSKDITSVFLRRSFSVDASKFTFLHVNVKRSEACDVVVYLNEKEVARLSGPAASNQHLTFPISTLSSSSVLAVEIRRSKDAAETAPIVFDALVSSASSGCIVQSVNGVASSDQSTADRAKYAFDMKSNYWSPLALPATLRYTFANASLVVNRVGFYAVNYAPKTFRVEGVNADNSTVVLYSVQEPHFMRNNIRILTFENMRAFPAYQFVFEDAEEKYLSISDVRFLSCTDRQCKKKSRYPTTDAGVTRYGKCPFSTVGTNQMHCVEGDNTVSWEEDRSGCVKKTPSQGWSYLDWTFELTGVKMSEWEAKVHDIIIDILTSHLKVAAEEISFPIIRDTTDADLKLTVFSRMTLEVEIGDYILKHFKLFLPSLNAKLKEKTKNVSIVVQEYKLHEPVNVAAIVLVVVTVAIVLVVIAFAYYIQLRLKSVKKTKSLKHLKGEALLTESV